MDIASDESKSKIIIPIQNDSKSILQQYSGGSRKYPREGAIYPLGSTCACRNIVSIGYNVHFHNRGKCVKQLKQSKLFDNFIRFKNPY